MTHNEQPIGPAIDYRYAVLPAVVDAYGNPVWVRVCSRCGSVVMDVPTHDEFHEPEPYDGL